MRTPFLVCLAFSTPLAAQPDHFTSSPPGWENVEGASASSLIGSSATLRYQQIIGAHPNALGSRSRIAFRRDGLLPDNAAYGARTLDMELTMSGASFGSASQDFASNMVSNTTIVVARKPVSFPDWSVAPPPGMVAPHDAVVNFDSGVLWSKPVNADYLFEIRIWSNDQAGNGYPMDADTFVQTVAYGASSSLGSGCVVPGQSRAFSTGIDISNDGSQLTFDISISRGVAGAPATLFAGLSSLGGVRIGLCEDVWVAGPLVQPITLDPNGDFALSTSIPRVPAHFGLSIFSQSVVLDASQPGGIAISTANDAQVPADPTNAAGVRYVWSRNPDDATGAMIDGGVVLHTNHP